MSSSSDMKASVFFVMAPSMMRGNSSRILDSGGPGTRSGSGEVGRPAPGVRPRGAIGGTAPIPAVDRAGVARTDALDGGVGIERVGWGGVGDPNAGIPRNGVGVLTGGAATRGE